MTANRSIDHLIRTNIVLLTGETSFRAAYQHMLGGKIVIIIDSHGLPLGILTKDMAAGLFDSTQSLGFYRESFAIPAITTTGTLLYGILQSLLFDKTIRWYVVFNGTRIVGILNPDDLLSEFPDDDDWLGPDSPHSPLPIFGNPLIAPSDMCYCCNHQQPHRISPEAVERRTIEGHALCPIHQTIMRAENPCREKKR